MPICCCIVAFSFRFCDSLQYNCLMIVRNRYPVILVLLGLLAAVFGPVIYVGFRDLRAAQSAQSEKHFPDAERYYESAALKLFWRNDLWEQAGLAAYHNGDRDNSIRLLEIARQKNSLSPVGWNTLGIDVWGEGDQAGAISIWKSALQSYPSFAPLYDQLISAYYGQSDYVAERGVLVKRLALGDDAVAHYRLGLLLILTDQHQAQQELKAASSLDPEFNSVATTLLFALNAAGREPDPSQKYVVIGRGLGLVEEWNLAAMSFENAVNLDGQNAEAWAWLGEALQHQGRNGKDDLDRALSLDSRDTVVLALRGLYWKRQGRFTQALAEYQRAAGIEPGNPAWQISIGESFTLNGDLVSALAAYQKAASLAPADATYWRLLAMFSSDNGVQVAEIGLPAAQKAAAIAPDDPQVLDALGWSYLNAGYLYTAEQNLLRAIKLEPDLALAHIHLAETYLQKGDRASAFVELDDARRFDANGSYGQLAAQLLKQYFP
jgi:tetratricopeptide (TPR) repeat protein